MTFTLMGCCARTSRMGLAIASSSPAVGARCVHLRPGVGVAASQNVTDPRLGPAVLEALAAGAGAERAIAALVDRGDGLPHRQLAVVAANGDAAAHTGVRALGRHGHRIGDGAVAAGNLLADDGVLDAMLVALAEGHELDLAHRLVRALRAGLDAGGEQGPVHSAALAVTGDVPWPVVDLRVDWSDDPVADLDHLWEIYAPQVGDYVARALDPHAAPAYGVPGE